MKEYKPPQELTEAKTMIAQLNHAVERNNGKTTVTENDIRVIAFLIRQFERYDQMASF